MKYMLALTVAVLLTASSVHSVSAQAPALTNADVVHLVAMHVSDQTVIAVIHEATATHFDVGEVAVSYLAISGVSSAVIAAMRQPTVIAAPVQLPTAVRPQTLGEASAEALKVKHEWPVSTYTGSSSLPVLPAAGASTSEGTKSEGTTTVTKSGVKDEAYWRDRMTTLRTACEAKAAAVKSFDDLEKQKIAEARKDLAAACPGCAQNTEFRVTLPAVVQAEREKAKAELAVCNANISSAEEEGRVAGVPSGWLRPR